MDQTQTPRYVSRFEHTALRPRLHTEGFPLTCPHRTPTQGASTEDLRQIQSGVHNSSLNQYNLSLKARHKQITSTLRGTGTKPNYNPPLTRGIRHKATQTQSLHTWGIPTQSPPLTRGSQIPLPLSPQTWGISTQSPLTRGISPRWKVYNLVVSFNHKPISFLTKQWSYR